MRVRVVKFFATWQKRESISLTAARGARAEAGKRDHKLPLVVGTTAAYSWSQAPGAPSDDRRLRRSVNDDAVMGIEPAVS